jgi:hypothetical protein
LIQEYTAATPGVKRLFVRERILIRRVGMEPFDLGPQLGEAALLGGSPEG